MVLQKEHSNMLVNTTLHAFRNNTQQENWSVINNLNRNGTLKNWSNISLFQIACSKQLEIMSIGTV